MLSIVISSYRENFYKNLSANIAETIGNIQYEIIKVHNPSLFSISLAYNKGAESAKFEHLLFIHEDVKFLSKDWGEELLRSLNKIGLGLIGIAGGEKKYKLPTGHDVGIDQYRKVYVNHQDISLKEKITSNELIKVKTLDGVFLAMKKELWEELKFNEDMDGFHFYDLDISLRSAAKYQNYVNSDISLFHFSAGNFGNEWICASLDFHKKKYCFDVPEKDEKVQIRKFWYKRLLNENISFWNRIRYVSTMGWDKKSRKDAVMFILRSDPNIFK